MLKTRSLISIPIALALGLTLAGPTAVANDDFDGPLKAVTRQDTARERAQDTLKAVQGIVAGDAASRGGRSADGRDLTIALRDLKLQMQYLSPADREAAARYFLRPGDPGDPYIPGSLPLVQCGPQICVHYTESGGNAAKDSDGNNATIPAYVTQVLNTIEQVNTDYIAAGYRTPVRDGAAGGDTNKIDIYLGNIGNQGLYGFCTTDDPKANLSNPGTWNVSAYCALDNDYDPSEFGQANTYLENMQVTAAHEFFHAVQYAYDFGEDAWILESTATWVEDEMFDDVNDNRFYLNRSPLALPFVPIDYFGIGDPPELGGFHYGTWIFWRYLTEKFTGKTGKLPTLVLDVWKRLDGASGGPDQYSTQGLAHVLNARGTSVRSEIAKFHTANRNPKKTYSEGGANAYKPGGHINVGLSKSKPAKFVTWDGYHMAMAPSRFIPKSLPEKSWKVRLQFDYPPTARGSAASVVVYKKNGSISTSTVKLSKKGNATKTFAFSSRSIRSVEVLMINTSTRFNCPAKVNDEFLSTLFSCEGTGQDDGLRYKVTGRAFR